MCLMYEHRKKAIKQGKAELTKNDLMQDLSCGLFYVILAGLTVTRMQLWN